MNNNHLFKKTQLSLTCWYASIFSGIIALGTLGVYESIVHAHYVTINNELKTVAGTFHDTLEPLLIEPNKLDKTIKNILPDLCLVKEKCKEKYHKNRYITRLIQQGKYYFKFYDLSGNLLGNAGINIDKLYFIYLENELKNIKDSQQINYRQLSVLLHTKDNQEWGYLLIGRSLEDFDNYVNNIKWFLLLGLPLLIILVILASWYLAKKAMLPVYKSYQQIQQFSSDVAHELRTPLAAIKATIDSVILAEKLSIKDYQEILLTINRQNQRIINLVNDLLTLSRLDAINENKHIIEKTDINLLDLIHDLTEELAFLAVENNIKLQQNIQSQEIIIIRGNEAQIYRLLSNLVVNAIQNTPEHGLVTILLSVNKKEVVIKIIDTGIGISEEDKPLIFNRFYRVDKSRNHHQGNSGLGLAIVNSIVLFHNGRIELKSKINQGSIFSVYLPKS
ncbi:two-component system sensor histidine kinase RppB [Geminocystis sp. NIES-3709]|uniref:two-component system sensor histidine kinase RppB n=1 Tax=Geminocystis sp. NIES-3709 TaxID=1617448 RepID=UPI0005FC4B95|nr:two-component system sensor histidine kinase RppB [Geminocystis sp. NIES-3709]BAQ64742.1 phosphate regulon sensor protein PhoR [Geminocystis sp. NIES-3709]